MSQSLAKNYVHLVFSTKYREHLIHPPHEEELFAYMGGTCKRMDCPPIKIGGFTDHVHILCMLSKKIALMKLLEEVKSHSSLWIKPKADYLKNFYWQDGYGAFSVSPTEVDKVSSYIDNQKKHHATMGFKDEFRAMLKRYNVDYDERYIWN